MRKRKICITFHERSVYLNQRFVIPKVIVDDRLASQGFRPNGIEFADSCRLVQCLCTSAIGRCVQDVTIMNLRSVRAKFKGIQKLSVGSLPVPVISPTYPCKLHMGVAVLFIQL